MKNRPRTRGIIPLPLVDFSGYKEDHTCVPSNLFGREENDLEQKINYFYKVKRYLETVSRETIPHSRNWKG